MRAIILADTHFDYKRDPSLTARKERAIRSLDSDVDCVLLCGDNAELRPDLSDHKKLFAILKNRFCCPIGFVAGNHELWGGMRVSSEKLLWEVLPSLAEDFEMTYLEKENLRIEGITIAGTYGHFDYSLSGVRGGSPTQEFITGYAIINGIHHQLRDRIFMDWQGKSDEEVTSILINALEERIRGKTELITISHTVPNKQATGHPETKEQDFSGLFSGTEKLERIIQDYRPVYHFCGHTHAPAQLRIGESIVFNIGTDYDDFRYALLDTAEKSVQTCYVKL